jgi:hypothetical protein
VSNSFDNKGLCPTCHYVPCKYGHCLCNAPRGCERADCKLALPEGAYARVPHGLAKAYPAEYGIYRSMLNRCANPLTDNYQYYGGRGIRVCSRWRHPLGERSGFEHFLADMGPRPAGMTIDRRDNDGCYEPDNCRWATHTEQIHNQRPRKVVTHAQAQTQAA